MIYYAIIHHNIIRLLFSHFNCLIILVLKITFVLNKLIKYILLLLYFKWCLLMHLWQPRNLRITHKILNIYTMLIYFLFRSVNFILWTYWYWLFVPGIKWLAFRTFLFFIVLNLIIFFISFLIDKLRWTKKGSIMQQLLELRKWLFHLNMERWFHKCFIKSDIFFF